MTHPATKPADPPPLYQRVKDSIVERILEGTWAEGARIPSENRLTKELGVSRMTVNRALRELASEGWLTRSQGVGTFVAETRPEAALLEIQDIRQDILARGHEHRCDVIKLEARRASAEEARSLEFRRPAELYHAIMVHREDGVPVQLEDRLVNPAFAPNYLEQDFSNATSFSYLMARAPAGAAEHIIEAILPDAETCRLLEIEVDHPCLLLDRRTWAGGLVATRVRLTFPGRRYRLAGYRRYESD